MWNNLCNKFFDYPAPLWRAYSAVAFVLVVISVPIWATVILVRNLFPLSRENATWYLKAWNDFVLWIFRLRVDVLGQSNYQVGAPALVVSNHQSIFDIPVSFAAMPGDLRMVAKKELFDIPFFGHVLAKTEFISVDRDSRGSGKQVTDEIRSKVRSGINVWVAPEGTRSTKQQLLPFKKGAFAVAIDAQIPVQPIVIENSIEALPKKELLVRTGTVIRLHVLPRVSTEGYQISQRGQLAELTRNLMQEALVSHNK